MTPKRKKAEETILKYIKKIGGNANHKLYVDLFKDMNDKEFHAFMEALRSKKKTLSIIVPNGTELPLDTKKNLDISRELGYEPFQRVVTYIPGTNKKTLSSVKSLIFYMPFKRLAQHMVKKISLPEHTRSRNHLTDQVSGASRATKITGKELSIFLGKNYKAAMDELMIARTGDLGATTAMNAFIAKYGDVSIKDIEKYATNSRATKTLRSYFKAMHLDVNI